MSATGKGFAYGLGGGCGLMAAQALAALVVLSLVCGGVFALVMWPAMETASKAREEILAAKTVTATAVPQDSPALESDSQPEPQKDGELAVVIDPPKPAMELHTWKDASGEFEIEAEFVSLEKSVVTLRKGDGTTVEIPLGKLAPQCVTRAIRLAKD